MLAGFFIGIVLAGALFLGPLHPTTTKATEDTGATSGNETTIDLSGVDIKLMLTDTASKIDDADTRQYYQTLMDRYQIDQLPSASERSGNSSVLDILPDMQRVSNSAIVLPLEEAGKNIRDPDIARFYQKLLSDAGWNVQVDTNQ